MSLPNRLGPGAVGPTFFARRQVNGVWFAAAPDAYSTTVIADNPSSYWRLDEPSGTTAIDQTGVAAGTYFNATLNQPGLLVGGIADAAYVNNGGAGSTASYVDLGNVYSFTGTSAFTLEIWCAPTDLSIANRRLFSSRATDGGGIQGYELLINTAGGLQISRYLNGANDAVFTSNGILVAGGGPYHIVATYDGTNLRIYVNGVLKGGPTASSKSIIANIGPFRVGSAIGAAYFTGTLDEAAVYPVALSASQVLAHYNAGGWAAIAAAETAHTSEVVSRNPVLFVSASETTSTSDTPGETLEYTTTAVESIGPIADVVFRMEDENVVKTDASATSDVPSESLVSFVTTSDATSSLEAASVSIPDTVLVQDVVATSETQSEALTSFVSVTDSTTTTEGVSAPFPSPVVAVDGTSLVETTTERLASFVSTTDIVASVESASAPFPSPISAQESTTTSEAQSATIASRVSVVDTTTTSENASGSLPGPVSVRDSTSVLDATTEALVLSVAINNATGVSDASATVVVLPPLSTTSSDALVLSDRSVVRLPPRLRLSVGRIRVVSPIAPSHASAPPPRPMIGTVR